VWWPCDLWRVSKRVLRSERCWERAERVGSLERMASDSVSSSSRAFVNGDGKREGEEREREEREIGNFLLISKFAEELQYSANLLSTVAPHHFAEPFVESAANDF
jgi:hypothetical protein